jgi:MFS family permease
MRQLRLHFYYGWVVLAAIAGINFANGATAIGVLTVFILPFTQDFGWTRTQISAVTSVGAILGAIVAPFTGRLTDRLGARLPLTLGGVFIVLATLCLAAMQSLTGFYLAFAVARLADQGFVQAPSPPAIAKWFQRYRGRAMAVLFFVSSLGGVALPLLVQVVIDTWHWRVAWIVLSAIMLCVGLVPCALWVRRQPEDLGLCVDGKTSLQPSLAPQTGQETAQAANFADDEASWQLSQARQTSTLWFFLASAFVIGMVSTGVTLHIVPYFVQQGVTSMAAVEAVSLGFLASGVGNLLWGYVADRLSARFLLILAYSLRMVSLAVLLVTDTVPEAYGFALLQGFADGGIRTLTAVLLADYYGRQHLGAIYGLLRAVQVAGFALGPLVAGLTFDLTLSYDGAFQAFWLLSVIGTVLIILARPPVRT